jgi:chromatin remodeling complex protein RSC6
VAQRKQGYHFHRVITSVDDRQHIYIAPSSQKESPTEERAPRERERPEKERKQEIGPSVSFFGHHIGALLTPVKAEKDEFLPIDKELDSSLEVIRKKLQQVRTSHTLAGDRISEEEIKHLHFIEDRNRAQEELFEDIIRSHREFGTGLTVDDLWSLHDLMQKEANHEAACSEKTSFHEHVECSLLRFLRKKAGEQAWKQVEDSIVRDHIPFPMPSSMIDHAESERTEQIGEERKKQARDDLLQMPVQQSAELILGNVPVWVYSYPAKNTYLWHLTVLQGVAAGLAAQLLIEYLAIWEKNSAEMLKKIQKEFMDKIKDLRDRGESATDISKAFSVSMELQRISREEIPDYIWKYIFSKLKAP